MKDEGIAIIIAARWIRAGVIIYTYISTTTGILMFASSTASVAEVIVFAVSRWRATCYYTCRQQLL